MDKHRLQEKLKKLEEPKFRSKQILKAIYQDGILDFKEMTVLPKNLRLELKKEIKIISLAEKKILISKDGKTVKALFETDQRDFLETVLMPSGENIFSVCVSSQIGCALGCAFCATGKMGVGRNLEAEEIEDQVLFWKNYLKKNIPGGKISNIVYMGMGEPFLNFENVAESVRNLIDPELFGFGSRSISVSTAGIMDKWLIFSRLLPQINLALSLHSANDIKRSKIMPINRKYNLIEIKKILQEYFKVHKRKIFIEYIMLKDFNDTAEDARELVSYLKSIGNSHLLHVNLIAYNMGDATQKGEMSTASSKDRVLEFRNYLLKNRINATIRKSLGQDIQGACGQLAVHQASR